ncbi:hypothetical protein ACFQE1_01760 [Halobium palmae]|uniref:Uncharacterized protein n=1 Tax=Halobium palmae TaxID=1776492 RepID=A0ABD5RV99_9EURY
MKQTSETENEIELTPEQDDCETMARTPNQMVMGAEYRVVRHRESGRYYLIKRYVDASHTSDDVIDSGAYVDAECIDNDIDPDVPDVACAETAEGVLAGDYTIAESVLDLGDGEITVSGSAIGDEYLGKMTCKFDFRD